MQPIFHTTLLAKTAAGKILLQLSLALALLASGLWIAAPVKAGSSSLTGVLPAYSSLSDLAISGDSKYVIFTADIDEDERFELYSVPITGTLPTRLNPDLVAGGHVRGAEITPDSSRVIYTAHQEADRPSDLYSVPIGGGEAIKLNRPAGTAGGASVVKIDPVTGQVIFKSNADNQAVDELYGVPAAGGPIVKYNPPVITGGAVGAVDIDPVSGRVVFTFKPDASSRFELYSVPLTGGTVEKLNPPVLESIESFSIAPNVAYVMFVAKQTGSGNYELFGNDTAGGAPRKRSTPLAAGENVVSFRINPTATRVVYTVTQNNTRGKGSLWNASPFSGSSQMLSEVAVPMYGVAPYDFKFTPNGERVVFGYQKNENSTITIQSVFILGGPLEVLNLLTTDRGFTAVVHGISPDSQRVVLTLSFGSEPMGEIYSMSITGGDVKPLGVGAYPVISPDGQRVIYTYTGSASDNPDVISNHILGEDLRNISQTAANSDAYDPLISPDGKWVVYKLDIENGAAGHELRASDGEDLPNPPPPQTPTPTAVPTPTLPSYFVYLPMLEK